MNNYMYGTECSICHAVNPEGRYLPHKGRFVICGNHSRQEVDDWQSQPESRNRTEKRNDMARKMFNKSWRQLDGFLRHAVNLALKAKWRPRRSVPDAERNHIMNITSLANPVDRRIKELSRKFGFEHKYFYNQEAIEAKLREFVKLIRAEPIRPETEKQS